MPRWLVTLRVVQEAENVADEVGLTNLTLAAIAPRLGVRMPSLYKHVAGMEALQRLVSIRAKTELADVFARAAAGKAGAHALTAMFAACRVWAKAHPGRYAATVRAPEPEDNEHIEASNAVLDIVLAGLAGFHLTGDDAIDAVRALRATLHGHQPRTESTERYCRIAATKRRSSAAKVHTHMVSMSVDDSVGRTNSWREGRPHD